MKTKLTRTFVMLLAALVCMGGFSVTAYAGGGPEYEEPIPEPAEETTGGYEPEPLTPDGNMTLVDDIDGEAAEDKQFITVVTKNGNYFYIIIDRADDGENTVHFLNQVDEADLLSLMEDETAEEPIPTCVCTDKCVAGDVNTSCPVCKTDMTQCTGKEAVVVEPAPADTVEPEPEPEESGGMGSVVVVILILVVLGGGAFYYFKVLKNKPSTKGQSNLDDYDFDDDEDDAPEEYDDDGADLDEYSETESAADTDEDSEDTGE